MKTVFPILNSRHSPMEHGDIYEYLSTGMTLLDYFASTATEADVRHYQKKIAKELDDDKGVKSFSDRTNADHVPREYAKYRYAKEMMKARGYDNNNP